jgi:large subunit ribosomal protein L37Ae
MTRTKLGSASRFGSRYGSPLKKKVRDIEKVQKRAQECPQCGRRSLKRKGYARWECKKCGAVMAGGAYSPQTGVGTIARRIVERGEKYEEVAEEIEAAEAEAAGEAEKKPAEKKEKLKKKKEKEIKVNVPEE